MKLTESQLRKIIAQESKSILKETSKRRSLVSLIFEAEGDAPAADAGKDVELDVSKGPSAAVAYLNGPGADKRVRALLDAGKEDGSPEDEAAKISEGSAKIGDLVPTQVEIELTKSIAYPLAKFDSLKKMISGGVQKIGPAGNDMIVKSGNLIVDGHHRWSSLFSVAGPGGVIAAIDIELPEKDAASVLAIVQTAIATTLDGPVPKAKAGGMNILGVGKDEIAGMITEAYESGSGEAGPILTNEFVLQCLEDGAVSKHFGIDNIRKQIGISTSAEDAERSTSKKGTQSESLLREKVEQKKLKFISQARKIIINKVADNLSQMNQPAEGAPPRVDMPQLDKADGGVQGVMKALKSGEVNYKAPFASESAGKSGDLLVERWQKIAGIIK